MENNGKERLDYPIKFAYAKGKYVYFRYLTEEDAIGDWHLWFNTPQVTRFMLARKWFNTVDDQLQYLKYVQSTKDRLTLAVVDISTNKHIGICSLGSISYIHRHAEMSCVIGDEKFRKGQHSLETLAMITEIGFSRLNLNKIYATGLEINQGGVGLTKLLGFKESGRFKEHCFVDGEYKDAVILEMFQRDWVKSKHHLELKESSD